MTGTINDELILAHLEAAGPQTTREIAEDLPSVGRATYGRLRALHRRGLVSRVSAAPSTTVLWWHDPDQHPSRQPGRSARRHA